MYSAIELGERSLPSRGAWIEIRGQMLSSPYLSRRSPHGERGLKSGPRGFGRPDTQSLPSRGAWIEIKLSA